jgi:SNF2 family DNA or RNA helicase
MECVTPPHAVKRVSEPEGSKVGVPSKRARREECASEFTRLLRVGVGADKPGLLRERSPEGEELLPLQYQKEAVKMLLSPSAKRQLLAAHAPGSGKTVLGALTHAALHVLYGEDTKCLFAVPTPTLRQWADTLRLWLRLRADEVLQVATSADVTEAALERAKAVVVSHGIVTTLYSADRPKHAPDALPEPERVSPLFRLALTMLVVDEAHLARNTNTVLCAALERLAASAKYRLALSGSPVTNAAADLAGIATVMGAAQQYRTPAFWGRKASVNQEALEAFQPHLHRVGEEELGLPGLRTRTVLFDLEFTTAQAAEYNRELSQLRSIARRIASERAGAQDASVALAVLSRLQQYPVSFELARAGANAVEDAKLARAASENLASHRALVRTLDEVFATSNRVCLFACHTSVLAVAASVVEASTLGCEVVTYVGGLSGKVREERLARFRKATGRVVMMLTIGAGGLGLHIGNAASHVIFWGVRFCLEPTPVTRQTTHRALALALAQSIGFTPAAREQAIRRLLRYGQQKEVCAYDVYARNTVEDGIRGIHVIKQAVTSAVVDRDLGPLAEVNSERLLRIVDCLLPIDARTGNTQVAYAECASEQRDAPPEAEEPCCKEGFEPEDGTATLEFVEAAPTH